MLDVGNGGAACGIIVTVSGLTVQDGATSDKAAGIWSCATLTLDSMTIRDNVVRAPSGAFGTATSLPAGGPAALGGGVFNDTSGALTIRSSTLSGNQALAGAGGSGLDSGGCGGCTGGGGGSGLGGAVFSFGRLNVVQSTFQDNAASGGAGGSGGPAEGGGGGSAGGAIFASNLVNAAETTISDSSFLANQIVAGPPGIVLGGSGGPPGGGASGGYGVGGGGAGPGGFGGCGSDPAGGGAGNSPCVLPPDASVLGGTGGRPSIGQPGTSGRGLGGAIGFFKAGAVTITGTTFAGNRGTGLTLGGALGTYGSDNSLAVSNTTFSGQSASLGSAIYSRLMRQGAFTVTNVSLGGNTGSAAIDQEETYPLVLRGVVMANHPDGACAGSLPESAGDNLSDQASCFTPNPSLNDRVITGTPLLGTLGDHGGPTQTIDLPAGSPAIDGVVHNPCPPPDTDQRGYLRPAGARCDIGAFEANALSPTPTPTITNTPTLTPTASRTPTATATSTPTATATLTPTATATATQTLTPTATATSTAALTPTNTPAATRTATPTLTSTPYPWPNVGVQAAPSGTPGRLRVTVTARDAGCSPNDQLSALHFTATTNATVDVGSVTAGTGDFTVPLAGGPAQTTFFVNRLAASQPATVTLVVTDGCGSWPTLVGGGPGAF